MKKNNFFGDFERAMELDFEKKLSRIRVQGEKRLDQIAIDGDRELARIKAEHDQKMSQLQAEHDQKMSQIQSEHDQKMSRMQEECNRKISYIEVDSKKKLAKIKLESEAVNALMRLGRMLCGRQLGINESESEVQKVVQTIKSHPLLREDIELQKKLKSLRNEDGIYFMQKGMEFLPK